jgi:undecaprenyl pyrophosphate phosphatase UppP
LLVGFVVSVASGALAITWLLQVVRRGRLALFGVYCIVAGLTVVLWVTRG